jgi:hypothetical protein
MAEEVFTWVTKVPASYVPKIVDELQRLHPKDPASDLPLVALPTLHFANVILFEHPLDPGAAGPPSATLVFEHNIDGPYREYARLCVDKCAAGLNRIYRWCEGYKGGDPEQILSFLAAHRRSPQLFHLGHVDRSVETIRGDFELRRSIRAELAANDPLRKRSPVEQVRELRRMANRPRGWRRVWLNWRPYHEEWTTPPDRQKPTTPLSEIRWKPQVRSWWRALRAGFLMALGSLLGAALIVLLHPYFPAAVVAVAEFGIVFGVVHRTSADARIVRGLIVAGVVVLVAAAAANGALALVLKRPLTIAAALVLMPVAALFLHNAYILATLKPARFPKLAAGDVLGLLEVEDTDEHGIYNHVAGLSIFRDAPGAEQHVSSTRQPSRVRLAWRRLRTRAALWTLNLFYRTQFVKGKLVTIPSIHFASWTLFDDGLLFLTNYEGSADRYLDDFFESLAQGVAFIWHDTAPFPRTTDPRRLKVWVRQSQTLAVLRYRADAYANLTVAAINNNTYIRRRLLNGWSPKTAQRFLDRLETTLPEDPSLLDSVDRQLRRAASTS